MENRSSILSFFRKHFAFALFLVFSVGSLKAAVTHYDEDYYSQITYSWTDASGVKHKSNLAERATEYEQIVAMLREVYVNPKVPGYVRDYTWVEGFDQQPGFGKNNFVEVPYEPCLAPGNPYGMEKLSKIETPVEGATAIIVELKDDYVYKSEELTCENLLRKIKALQLLTEQYYVSAEVSPNPGFVFNYVGSLNNFFIITKGNNRIDITHPHGFAPFYNMFEEFSPSNSGVIYDAYDAMERGEAFQITHNCSSVMWQNHIIVMSPEGLENQTQYPMNFMFDLPDQRFVGDTRYIPSGKPAEEQQWYTFYNTDHMPYFFFNQLKAQTVDVRYDETDLTKADVRIKWESNYNSIVGYRANEQYYIYRVVDDLIEDQPITDFTLVDGFSAQVGEDGSLVYAGKDMSVCIHEPRLADSYDVYYVVKGRRNNTDFEFMESNTVTANIVGYAAIADPNFNIVSSHKTAFSFDDLQNHYTQTIKLMETKVDGTFAIRRQDIKAKNEPGVETGTTFHLMRYTNTRDNAVEVARVEIESMETDTRWSQHQYLFHGKIVDADGNEVGEANFKAFCNHEDADDKQPLRAYDANKGALITFTDNLADKPNQAGSIKDLNYFLVYAPAVMEGGTLDASLPSNVVKHSILSTKTRSGYVPYTEAQINADTDFYDLLSANRAAVTFPRVSSQNVTHYSIYRLRDGEKLLVATAKRMPTGALEISRLQNDGTMAIVASSEVATPVVQLPLSAKAGDQYCVVINHTLNGTYGSLPSSLAEIPVPEIQSLEIGRAAYYANGDITDYAALLSWTTLDLGSCEFHGYRAWGLHSGADGHALTYDKLGGDMPARARDNRAVNLDANTVDHRHPFQTHEATEDNPVDYHAAVRLYSLMPSEMTISNSVTSGYAVSDHTNSAQVTHYLDLVTGIENVSAESEAPVEYFTLQGIPVSEPASGTIVIRRQGTSVSKVLIH